MEEARIIRICKRGVFALTAACIAATPALAQTPDDGLIPYVRARAADAVGAADIAARGYAAALKQLPGDQIVAMRAYRQGLAAGDERLAAQAADVLQKANAAPPDASLVRFTIALHDNDAAAARGALDEMERGPFDFMAPVLRAWMAYEDGKDGLAFLQPDSGNSLARRYAAENRALMLIASGKPSEGLIALRPLMQTTTRDSENLRIDAALLLASTNQTKLAQILLAGDAPELVALRRLASEGKLVRPGAAFGAARMFVGLASELAQEDMASLSIVLTRSALLLDPTDDRARLFLGEALSRTGSDRLALDVLAQVDAASPFARGARAGTIAALRRAGRTEEAVERAEAMAKDRHATSGDAQTYGDLLIELDRFADAADAYGRAIKRPGGKGDWSLHYLRGAALDQAGQWKKALPELRRAAELAPADEAQPITYLGSAQVRRGVDLDAAQALLERARAMRPDDAKVADALAWAYYQRGQVDRALPLLEQAAQDDPSGSRVNEHLGDAYWQLGRRYEARYAWKAAALYSEKDATARIQAKIANGPATAAN